MREDARAVPLADALLGRPPLSISISISWCRCATAAAGQSRLKQVLFQSAVVRHHTAQAAVACDEECVVCHDEHALFNYRHAHGNALTSILLQRANEQNGGGAQRGASTSL